MYHRGRGVAQNFVEAARLCQQAADQGDDFSQFELGHMFEHGIGVAQHDTEAVRWYQKSADQGFAKAQFKVGKICVSGLGLTTTVETCASAAAKPLRTTRTHRRYIAARATLPLYR
jgi:hypothetical protein